MNILLKNYKLIIIGAVILTVLIASVFTYIHINNLNNQIKDLNYTIVEKDTKIQQLVADIESLKKNVESMKNTLAITDNYINTIEKINNEEDIIKNAIYEEVISDETGEIKNWFNEKLPSDVVNILNDSTQRLCYDSL